MLPLTQVFILRRARNVPISLSSEVAEDITVLKNFMTQDECYFLDGFHKSKPRHTAESLKKGVKMIMRTTMSNDAKNAVMRNGDRALDETEIMDIMINQAIDDAEVVMDSQPP